MSRLKEMISAAVVGLFIPVGLILLLCQVAGMVETLIF